MDITVNVRITACSIDAQHHPQQAAVQDRDIGHDIHLNTGRTEVRHDPHFNINTATTSKQQPSKPCPTKGSTAFCMARDRIATSNSVRPQHWADNDPDNQIYDLQQIFDNKTGRDGHGSDIGMDTIINHPVTGC
ncbi:MAG: hypothetical protein V4724_30725 [Pseudomonadota bacterium]